MRRINNIADDCAAGGQIARTPAVKHNIADAVADKVHGVETARHRRKRMAAFNERRMHARLDFSVVVFADCKEFQRVAEFLPGVYVVHGNLRDALAIHPLYGHFL